MGAISSQSVLVYYKNDIKNKHYCLRYRLPHICYKSVVQYEVMVTNCVHWRSLIYYIVSSGTVVFVQGHQNSYPGLKYNNTTAFRSVSDGNGRPVSISTTDRPTDGRTFVPCYWSGDHWQSVLLIVTPRLYMSGLLTIQLKYNKQVNKPPACGIYSLWLSRDESIGRIYVQCDLSRICDWL